MCYKLLASPAARKVCLRKKKILCFLILCSFCMFRSQTSIFYLGIVRMYVKLISSLVSQVDANNVMKLDVHANENDCDKNYYFSFPLPHSDDDEDDNSVFSSWLLQWFDTVFLLHNIASGRKHNYCLHLSSHFQFIIVFRLNLLEVNRNRKLFHP